MCHGLPDPNLMRAMALLIALFERLEPRENHEDHNRGRDRFEIEAAADRPSDGRYGPETRGSREPADDLAPQ